jgi:hypothetical protein
MKNRLFYVLPILILFTYQEICVQAQITRGAQPGELYISSDWYLENNSILYYAILLSTDNGESISLQYANIETPPTGEMKIGKVLGDATPGALYNYGNSEQWVSFDYGESWEYRENYPAYTSFYAGVNQGLIFKGNNQGLFKSTDYAATFELLPINVTCPFTEVGFSEPEFYGIYGEPGLYYKFVHTLDYGQTYNEIPIDSLVAFWAPSGQFPKISRGAEQGELYLTSWTPELHYKVFHSVDTGYTWTEKYESDYIDIFYWGVQFTGGREQGSFYVMRARINPAGDHTWLYIDYSSDYGETFTTYFHDLDSTITGFRSFKPDNIKLSNYPNPFKEYTTISFSIPKNSKNPILYIYDVYGNPVREINISGEKTQIWHGTDYNGNRVKEGIYLYNVSYGSYISQFNKLVIIN